MSADVDIYQTSIAAPRPGRRVIASLRGIARELSWPDALTYAVARLLHVLSRGHLRLLKYVLVAQPVAALEYTPAHRGRGIAVTEASASEIRQTDFGRPAAVIEERIRLGSRCLLAYKDGELVGFQWFTTRHYAEDEVRCLFELLPEDRCAWDFDIFVMPAARAQPVFLRLWDSCNELLRREGIHQSLSRINAFNSASIRAHARMGARTIGTALFLAMGPMQIAWLPRAPWLHASLRRAPRLPVSRLACMGPRTGT